MSTQKTKVSVIQKFADTYSIDVTKVLSTLKKIVFKPKTDENGVVEEIDDVHLHSFLLVCQRYDLDPFRKEIIPFKDKSGAYLPVVTIDGWLKVITTHPQCDGFSFEFSSTVVKVDGLQREVFESCTCTMYRKDWKHPVPITEWTRCCYRPPIQKYNAKTKQYYSINTPWQTHFERMLQHKTMIQTARYTLGLGDIYDLDEAQRIVAAQDEHEVIEVHEQPVQAAIEIKESQTVSSFFEGANEISVEEAECVPAQETTTKPQSQSAKQQTKITDFSSVSNKDVDEIQQLIGWGVMNHAFSIVEEQLNERYQGATLAYGLEQLKNAQVS
ncbi:TPA: recombinase RecT [Photobacterium damselae]